MNQVTGDCINSTKFTWIEKSKEFVAEISDLAQSSPLKQLYADEGTQGFVMISARSSRAAEFELIEIAKDGEGEIQYWQFAPTRQTAHYLPRLRGVRVTILND